MADAEHDENNIPTIIVVSKDDNETPVKVATNPITGALIVEIG